MDEAANDRGWRVQFAKGGRSCGKRLGGYVAQMGVQAGEQITHTARHRQSIFVLAVADGAAVVRITKKRRGCGALL